MRRQAKNPGGLSSLEPEPPESTGNRHRVRSRVIVIMLSMLFVFVVLESAIRITGYVYMRNRRTESRSIEWSRQLKDKRVLLAIGDSMTYGVGASVEMDYPSQLVRMLNHEVEGDSFVMVNTGRGGANTTMMLDLLPQYLDLIQPEAAIVLAGCDNSSNYYGYNKYRQRHTAGTILTNLLFRIRIFRFFQFALPHALNHTELRKALISDGLAGDLQAYLKWHRNSRQRSKSAANPEVPEQFLQGTELLQIGAANQALDTFAGGLEAEPLDSSILWGMGMAMRVLRDTDQAEQWFRKALAADPGNPNNYYAIGLLYIDTYTKHPLATEMFRTGIQRDPSFAGNYWGMGMIQNRQRKINQAMASFMDCVEADPLDSRCYPNMIALAMQNGRKEELIAFLDRFDEQSPVARDSMRMLEQEVIEDEVLEWIQSDLTRLFDLLSRRGIRIIVQNYPFRDNSNLLLQSLAQAHKLPFVDQYVSFTEHLQSGSAVRDLFIADNMHCNDTGYGLMAANIFQVMKEQVLNASSPRKGGAHS